MKHNSTKVTAEQCALVGTELWFTYIKRKLTELLRMINVARPRRSVFISGYARNYILRVVKFNLISSAGNLNYCDK